MSFRKAKPEQAAIKMSGYGPPGSGKTFSTLLFAEGLANHTGKRIAYIDTERGTDFYAMPVLERQPHPEAFDFDAIYTRSITEVLKECRGLKPNEHGIIVLDSITHLWEAAMNSYSGPKTRAGTIPMWAWGKIKAPYKELMKFLIDSPYHVFILGRQSNSFEEDADTGESKAAGVKMRAEGETAYEPHICLHFAPIKNKKTNAQIISVVAEKDRSGILSGKTFDWPNYATIIKPLLGILGTVQAIGPSDEDAANQDAEANANAEKDKLRTSADLREKYLARFSLAESVEELKKIGGELTPAVKKLFSQTDLAAVRAAFLSRDARLKGNHNGADHEQPVANDVE